MSDPRLAAISESLDGTPEEIVERSAAARAQAQGISVDEVIGAWTGGGALATPAATTPEPAADPASDPAPSAPVADVEAPAAPAAVATMAAVIEPPVVEEAEPVEPAALGERIVAGARIGAILGGLLGVAAILVSLPMIIGRLGLPSGEATPAVEVTPLAALLTIAGLSAVFGAVITLAARGIGSLQSASYRTRATTTSSTALGLVNGAVLGFIAGGIVVGTAETTVTSTRLLPTRSLVFSVIIGGVILGAIAGGLAQGMGQPATLRGDDAEEAGTVQRRLMDSMAIPLVASVIILVIVVSLGSLLVQYPSFAPLVAILVSIGILAFASLMASRPNLRITRGEVLTAAAGVGVLLLMLALVASQVAGSGHGEEEDETHSIGLIQTG